MSEVYTRNMNKRETVCLVHVTLSDHTIALRKFLTS